MSQNTSLPVDQNPGELTHINFTFTPPPTINLVSSGPRGPQGEQGERGLPGPPGPATTTTNVDGGFF